MYQVGLGAPHEEAGVGAFGSRVVASHESLVPLASLASPARRVTRTPCHPVAVLVRVAALPEQRSTLLTC